MTDRVMVEIDGVTMSVDDVPSNMSAEVARWLLRVLEITLAHLKAELCLALG